MVRTGYSGESIGKGTPSPPKLGIMSREGSESSRLFPIFPRSRSALFHSSGIDPESQRVRPKDSRSKMESMNVEIRDRTLETTGQRQARSGFQATHISLKTNTKAEIPEFPVCFCDLLHLLGWTVKVVPCPNISFPQAPPVLTLRWKPLQEPRGHPQGSQTTSFLTPGRRDSPRGVRICEAEILPT